MDKSMFDEQVVTKFVSDEETLRDMGRTSICETLKRFLPTSRHGW